MTRSAPRVPTALPTIRPPGKRSPPHAANLVPSPFGTAASPPTMGRLCIRHQPGSRMTSNAPRLPRSPTALVLRRASPSAGAEHAGDRRGQDAHSPHVVQVGGRPGRRARQLRAHGVHSFRKLLLARVAEDVRVDVERLAVPHRGIVGPKAQQQPDKLLHALGVAQTQDEAEPGSPVVADQVVSVEIQRVEQGDDMVGELDAGVAPPRRLRPTEAAKVDGQDAILVPQQRYDVVSPSQEEPLRRSVPNRFRSGAGFSDRFLRPISQTVAVSVPKPSWSYPPLFGP